MQIVQVLNSNQSSVQQDEYKKLRVLRLSKLQWTQNRKCQHTVSSFLTWQSHPLCLHRCCSGWRIQKSHSANRRCSGRPQKMRPCTIHCWRDLALKRRLPVSKKLGRKDQDSDSHFKNHKSFKRRTKLKLWSDQVWCPWLESDGAPLAYFKAEGRATKPLQQGAEKLYLWRMTEHLSRIYARHIIRDQQDHIAYKI